MSLFEKIALIIISTLIALFLLYLIFVISRLVFFSRRMKTRRNCLAVNAAELRRLILLIHDFFTDNGEKLPQESERLFKEILVVTLESINGKNAYVTYKKFKNYLKTILKYMNLVKYLSIKNFSILKADLDSLEIEIRKEIALYNSDADAFNYWLTCGPTKFVLFPFRFKKVARYE